MSCLSALYQHEVDDAGGSYTTEQRDAVFHVLLVVEGEHDTCQPLYQHTEEEGNGYGYKMAMMTESALSVLMRSPSPNVSLL